MTCFAAKRNAISVIAMADQGRTRFSPTSLRATSERPRIRSCRIMPKASRMRAAMSPTRAALHSSISVSAAFSSTATRSVSPPRLIRGGDRWSARLAGDSRCHAAQRRQATEPVGYPPGLPAAFRSCLAIRVRLRRTRHDARKMNRDRGLMASRYHDHGNAILRDELGL